MPLLPAEVPAEKAVWLASPATDRKTGLIVRVFGPRQMISGALQEGWRRLTRQNSDSVELTVTPVAKVTLLPQVRLLSQIRLLPQVIKRAND